MPSWHLCLWCGRQVLDLGDYTGWSCTCQKSEASRVLPFTGANFRVASSSKPSFSLLKWAAQGNGINSPFQLEVVDLTFLFRTHLDGGGREWQIRSFLPLVQRVDFCMHQNEESRAGQGDGMIWSLVIWQRDCWGSWEGTEMSSSWPWCQSPGNSSKEWKTFVWVAQFWKMSAAALKQLTF